MDPGNIFRIRVLRYVCLKFYYIAHGFKSKTVYDIYIFIRVTGLAIPCIFRKITGFLCPGCGITRAILAAVRLDLAKAFAYNQFMFIALPALAYIIVKNDYVFVRYGNRKLSRFDNILIFICIAGAVMFAVLRNVMRF